MGLFCCSSSQFVKSKIDHFVAFWMLFFLLPFRKQLILSLLYDFVFHKKYPINGTKKSLYLAMKIWCVLRHSSNSMCVCMKRADEQILQLSEVIQLENQQNHLQLVEDKKYIWYPFKTWENMLWWWSGLLLPPPLQCSCIERNNQQLYSFRVISDYFSYSLYAMKKLSYLK